MSLHATDEQLDFPVIYASAKEGYAKVELEHVSGTMEPLFDAIIKHIPPPRAHAGEGFKMLVANLDYSDYLGRIAFGKIYGGKVKVGDPAVCIHGDGRKTQGQNHRDLSISKACKRIEIQEAHAGDIVGLTGFEDVFIGETITDSEDRAAACPSCRSIRRPFRWSSPSTTARSPARTASSSPRANLGAAGQRDRAPTSPCASKQTD